MPFPAIIAALGPVLSGILGGAGAAAGGAAASGGASALAGLGSQALGAGMLGPGAGSAASGLSGMGAGLTGLATGGIGDFGPMVADELTSGVSAAADGGGGLPHFGKAPPLPEMTHAQGKDASQYGSMGEIAGLLNSMAPQRRQWEPVTFDDMVRGLLG